MYSSVVLVISASSIRVYYTSTFCWFVISKYIFVFNSLSVFTIHKHIFVFQCCSCFSTNICGLSTQLAKVYYLGLIYIFLISTQCISHMNCESPCVLYNYSNVTYAIVAPIPTVEVAHAKSERATLIYHALLLPDGLNLSIS